MQGGRAARRSFPPAMPRVCCQLKRPLARGPLARAAKGSSCPPLKQQQRPPPQAFPSPLTWHRVQNVVEQHEPRVVQHRADLRAENKCLPQPGRGISTGLLPGRGQESLLPGVRARVGAGGGGSTLHMPLLLF